jgi:peptide/nickel transport system ATP-binding protein
MSALLQVEDLAVDFRRPGWRRSSVHAVDGVSFTINERETVGFAGESGSGKSTIGRCVLGLIRPTRGRIVFDGVDITRLSSSRRRRLSTEIQVVFQDPNSSLNPARSIEQSLREPMEVARGLSRSAARDEVRRLLDLVGLPPDAATRHPNEFSGGQRQRIGIARALSVSPRLLVCDEPVSALDVSTQAQILNLILELQQRLGFALMFIGHDLSVIRHVSHRVVVPYQGRIMEMGSSAEVCDDPAHPYTQALLAAAPVPDPEKQRDRRAARSATVTATASGTSISPPEAGCPFAPRCPAAAEVCWSVRPRAVPIRTGEVACHLYDPTSGHPDRFVRSEDDALPRTVR